jgi:hypothetical protein
LALRALSIVVFNFVLTRVILRRAGKSISEKWEYLKEKSEKEYEKFILWQK